VADHPLRPATRLCLGEPLPRQLADGPQTPPSTTGHCWAQPLPASSEPDAAVCGISAPFGTLSPFEGQIIYVLRTRAPLSIATPCDLHVLGAPLTFALSQDQTLQLETGELLVARSIPALSILRRCQARLLSTGLGKLSLALRDLLALNVSLRFSFQGSRPEASGTLRGCKALPTVEPVSAQQSERLLCFAVSPSD